MLKHLTFFNFLTSYGMRIYVYLLSVLLFFAIANPNMALSQQLSEKLTKEIEENLAQAKQFEDASDYNQAAFYFNRTATVYWVNGFPSEAVKFFEKAVDMNNKIGNLNAIRTLYNNIGMVYADEEDYTKALEYFNKTLDTSRKLNRKSDVATALLNIANVQVELTKFSEAEKIVLEASNLAKELNDPKLLRNSYSLLADLYEKLGDPQKSSEYFSLYTAISRKVQQDETRKKEAEAQKMVDVATSKVVEVEAEKQATERELFVKKQALKETEENLEAIEQISKERQMQIELLNKEKELQEAVIENQRMVRNIFIVVIVAVLAFAGSIFYNLNQKKKANLLLSKQNREIAEQKDLIEKKSNELTVAFEKIEKQNFDITSSITYAQRIQQAMLPTEESLKNFLPESFILLKPRDIVSGDFYWFSGYASPKKMKEKNRTNYIRLHGCAEDESGFMITAVDCTGHGVPGAFMSMIGFNLLDTITRSGVVNPAHILNQLHESVRYLLKQYNTDNQDGMDMSFCHISQNGKQVLFAGAKNPVFYIANNELTSLKGDSVPIGGMQKESKREFTLHRIDVTEPTTFYLFSDGYCDQFGGLHNQKFGSKRFKEFLLQIHKLPMDEQCKRIEANIENWVGPDRKQIDDILVMGFKLGNEEIEL